MSTSTVEKFIESCSLKFFLYIFLIQVYTQEGLGKILNKIYVYSWFEKKKTKLMVDKVIEKKKFLIKKIFN